MLPILKFKLPRCWRGSHVTGRHGAARASRRSDERGRPLVATLGALGALGWHVTEIRPDRDASALWRVTITRYDGNLSFTLIEADPDVALEELARYAAADGEDRPR